MKILNIPVLNVSRLAVAAIIAIAVSRPGLAQHTEIEVGKAQEITATDLPDEPQPLLSRYGLPFSSSATPADSQQTAAITLPQPKRVAPVFHRYIEPGEVAQRLTLPQQLVFGFAQSISPYFLLTVTGAAGYEQAVNGAPNYGSNFDAFGRRVGAAAIRNTSQAFFADSAMAILLHEDPRFYVMGVRRSAFARAAYAASRVVVTRDADDGHLVPNYAELSGYAEAALLTDAYYPAANVHVRRTISSYGLSLGGSAISNVVREFYPSLRNIALRIKPLNKAFRFGLSPELNG